MKKINRLFLALVLMIFSLFSTTGFCQDNCILMDGDYKGITFDKFLDSVAVVYGVHSQLTKHERISIPEFDQLVKDMKEFLGKEGQDFLELAGKDAFVKKAGYARICSHGYYPDLEKIFKVKLPKQKPLVGICSEGISITKAIENVRNFIY